MKLNNRTRLPDAVLRKVLVKAGRAVGAKTSGRVEVVVSWGKGGGHAHKKFMGFDREFRLRLFITLKKPPRHWAHIRVYESRDEAESFYSVARHEWAHVGEYQGRLPGGVHARRSTKGRRPRWATRPEEQRAEAACADADALGKTAEQAKPEIDGLAGELDKLMPSPPPWIEATPTIQKLPDGSFEARFWAEREKNWQPNSLVRERSVLTALDELRAEATKQRVKLDEPAILQPREWQDVTVAISASSLSPTGWLANFPVVDRFGRVWARGEKVSGPDVTLEELNVSLKATLAYDFLRIVGVEREEER